MARPVCWIAVWAAVAETRCRRTTGGDRRLCRTRYHRFTARHFREYLARDDLCRWSPRGRTCFCNRKTCWTARRVGVRIDTSRPRRPVPGMMLHQYGSRHEWLAGHEPMDLIVTLDDATSEISSAFLVEEEGTASTFRALMKVPARTVYRIPYIPIAAVITFSRTSSKRR